MTTHCVSLGTGRYGSPSTNRAISLREASLIQSFPKNYKFAENADKAYMTKMARLIVMLFPLGLDLWLHRALKLILKPLGNYNQMDVSKEIVKK